MVETIKNEKPEDDNKRSKPNRSKVDSTTNSQESKATSLSEVRRGDVVNPRSDSCKMHSLDYIVIDLTKKY